MKNYFSFTARWRFLPFIFLLHSLACSSQLDKTTPDVTTIDNEEVLPGAADLDKILTIIGKKSVAFVVNHTSTIGKTHLVDTLLRSNVNIIQIFTPEHGFRGEADAGEVIKNGVDSKTGIPLISLHGKNKKLTSEMLGGIDLVIFDIQDVGARFYTYISTMHYVMEACAENKIPFVVLDRPNPNGHYVDGPVLDKKFRSFVGMHSIPVVHGMTVAELAVMINEEGWLNNGIKCDLSYILCKNYTHNTHYSLPIKPSPNLPNMQAIYLYPYLCFFEGTVLSVGRGTVTPFQVIGHPEIDGEYTFTPQSIPGAKYPKHENKICKGGKFFDIPLMNLANNKQLKLSYLIDFYQEFPDKETFFLPNHFFDTLAGTDILRKQIIAGKTEKEIRLSWQKDLNDYNKIREKYLLYP